MIYGRAGLSIGYVLAPTELAATEAAWHRRVF
jgi:hypothetical protein